MDLHLMVPVAIFSLSFSLKSCISLDTVLLQTSGGNNGADHPSELVGASMYSTISLVAFNRVMLNPGPSRLVMNVPDRTLDNLILLLSVNQSVLAGISDGL